MPIKSLVVSADLTKTLNFTGTLQLARSFVLIVRIKACGCYCFSPQTVPSPGWRLSLQKKVSAGFLMRTTASGTLRTNLSRNAHFAEELTQPSDALRGVNIHLPSLGPDLTFLSWRTPVTILKILHWEDQYTLNREALILRDRFNSGSPLRLPTDLPWHQIQSLLFNLNTLWLRSSGRSWNWGI